MADRVGPTGSVVAVDLDPRFLADHGRTNLEVRRMDLRTDDLGEAQFDIVHARAVLEHIPERDQILLAIVRSLRPGGSVLIEDLHLDDATIAAVLPYVRPADQRDLFARCSRGMFALVELAGGDKDYGARLPDALAEAGLVGVDASIHTALLPGGVRPQFYDISARAVQSRLIERNLLPETDIGQFLELAGKSGSVMPFPPVVSAWGRKPA